MAAPFLSSAICFLFVITWINKIPQCLADGTISIEFIEYINPGGKGSNGHCCDGRSIFCQRNGCDHKFTICLDDDDRPKNFYHCSYGNFQTNRIKNSDKNQFGSYIGGVKNPMSFGVEGGPLPNATLKVNVYDDDNGFTHDDFVEYLEWKYITPPSGSIFHLTLRGRSKLSVLVTTTCSPHWYGPSCETLCSPGTSDRYTCDSSTGQKVCDEGWIGANCDEIDSAFVDRPNADCDRLATEVGITSSGRYDIHVGQHPLFPVYCVVTPEGEGWTVIHQRVEGTLNFTRGWQEYRDGFGTLDGDEDFWLGLENMHRLTSQRRYKLRVLLEVGDSQGVLTPMFADYDYFTVAGEAENYRIHAEGYAGIAGDALGFAGFGGTRNHEGMPFTTYDRDNDMWPDNNCARAYGSGWWYNDCFWANLNGATRCSGASCLSWHTYMLHRDETLYMAGMMILPKPRF